MDAKIALAREAVRQALGSVAKAGGKITRDLPRSYPETSATPVDVVADFA
jgi:hypothetical protein